MRVSWETSGREKGRQVAFALGPKSEDASDCEALPSTRQTHYGIADHVHVERLHHSERCCHFLTRSYQNQTIVSYAYSRVAIYC